jgi:hypothetical protein
VETRACTKILETVPNSDTIVGEPPQAVAKQIQTSTYFFPFLIVCIFIFYIYSFLVVFILFIYFLIGLLFDFAGKFKFQIHQFSSSRAAFATTVLHPHLDSSPAFELLV